MPEPTYAFIDGVLDQIQAGESSSPVSQHLGMTLVSHGRGQGTYEKTPPRHFARSCRPTATCTSGRPAPFSRATAVRRSGGQ